MHFILGLESFELMANFNIMSQDIYNISIKTEYNLIVNQILSFCLEDASKLN